MVIPAGTVKPITFQQAAAQRLRRATSNASQYFERINNVLIKADKLPIKFPSEGMSNEVIRAIIVEYSQVDWSVIPRENYLEFSQRTSYPGSYKD